MYKRLCILALTHGARVLAAPHMRFGSSNGSGSYTGPKCDSPQTRCRSTRALTSQCSSNAPRYQLPEDVRKSPVHPRIEMQDTGEQIRLRMRRTLAGTWHWKERLGQRPMATLMLQHCSKHWDQCAPARRQSGRRTFDHLPPPPTWPVRLEAPATRCLLHLLSFGGSAGRRPCRSRLPTLQLGASSGRNHSGEDLLWHGHARPRRGTLLHKPVYTGK